MEFLTNTLLPIASMLVGFFLGAIVVVSVAGSVFLWAALIQNKGYDDSMYFNEDLQYDDARIS